MFEVYERKQDDEAEFCVWCGSFLDACVCLYLHDSDTSEPLGGLEESEP